jgi:hypothetical protein
MNHAVSNSVPQLDGLLSLEACGTYGRIRAFCDGWVRIRGCATSCGKTAKLSLLKRLQRGGWHSHGNSGQKRNGDCEELHGVLDKARKGLGIVARMRGLVCVIEFSDWMIISRMIGLMEADGQLFIDLASSYSYLVDQFSGSNCLCASLLHDNMLDC